MTLITAIMLAISFVLIKMLTIGIMVASVKCVSPAGGAQTAAGCLLCVFRCHQRRVEPVSGGQQLVHGPDAYEHLPLHSNPLTFLSGSKHSNDHL